MIRQLACSRSEGRLRTALRAVAMASVVFLMMGVAVGEAHEHRTPVEAAQCAVCHLHDPAAPSLGNAELELAPAIRVADLGATPVFVRPVPSRTLPPSTGPPASH